MTTVQSQWLDKVKWGEDGLVPAVAQEFQSGKLLTLAWMNRAALTETVNSGKAVYWSRSRQKLWQKGETSGHWQIVKAIYLDCDNDAILLKVEQVGNIACHTGRQSCFHQQLVDNTWEYSEPVLKEPEKIYGKK